MFFKSQGVVVYGLKPELFYALGMVDKAFRAAFHQEAVLTNGVAPRAYASLHGAGMAVDIRTREHFDWVRWRHDPELLQLVQTLRAELDTRGFDIVLEPDWLSARDLTHRFSEEKLEALLGQDYPPTVSDEQLDVLRREITPHLHIEFDPKKGEEAWPYVD